MPRTTAQLRRIWGPPCGDGNYLTIDLWTGVRITIDARTAEAWRAFDLTTQHHRYRPLPGQTGAYNCRNITGGTTLSLHAYGIATDLNWRTNPYRPDGRLITDYPDAMIADLEAIRTNSGAAVFAWGGRWDQPVDAMHWQIDATPADLATGIDWSTVAMPELDPDRPDTWPTLEAGERGPTVEQLQSRLNQVGAELEVDGVFGDATLEAVEDYQESRRLVVDGIVGPATWTALLTDQPVVTDGPGPTKAEPGPFPDVPADGTHAPAIRWADERGLLEGDEGGRFRPSEPMTRAQAATMARRLVAYLRELDRQDHPDTDG